ncbi:TetR family transcriptional regulator [Roseibium sp.]|uniref:TetR family transcriptional regulator n=1 Tax=Roseibium sp. TaxID=1936156 RepID=UPI003BAE22D8
MPRPKVDAEQIRETLLTAAERRLKRMGSARFSVTDLAADCRMSQSNVYRFFPNKASLMAALAERWFREIEAELTARTDTAARWQDKLTAFVHVQRELKSARYDQDPELFWAYLRLAEEHPEPVMAHVDRLQQILASILEPEFRGPDLAAGCTLVADATQLFRDPFLIARFRDRCTAERADAVLMAVLQELERRRMA